MSKWILIVDDEEATAWALAEGLREAGLETEIAHSTGEAVSKCHQRDYDLVITDVRLPDRSGLDFLGDLVASPPAPPAIVMSAFGGPEVEAAVERLGALAYFQKPFDVELLKRTVTTALAADRASN